ncbi:hypothetical protein [Streptomyces sp. VRA16 Mangrove soil]|uniref:hypothetical protein n=1 Tax=Streptomyces sp. VRA16 Mangrove soil TaxID=2817434 RepID=UPI001A9E3167|nr:hypothetical protein [Streptomyces sp. VRA16 Mangrove soil]MBO1335008.1 hypothetical protein [Streptomyces sp. VRA16 Mangrove soil]
MATDRLTAQLFHRMAQGFPFELSVQMARMKKLGRLVTVAELYGFHFLEARQHVFSISVAFTPDPDPQVRARAAQLWPYAPYIPELSPAQLKLDHQRVRYDLLGWKSLKTRLPLSLGCFGLLALGRFAAGNGLFFVAAVICLVAVIIGVQLLLARQALTALTAAGYRRVPYAPGRFTFAPPQR